MRPMLTAANPFVMMTDPEAILEAVERSERLGRLRRQVCRPLDRPLIPKVRAKETADFDAAIDLEDDVPENVAAEAGEL